MAYAGQGLLVLDKPSGITSHAAVQRVRRALGCRRAGHAGTLDPLATGVLLVGLGAATRLLEFLAGHDKRYRARIRLGERRDTLDREGRVLDAQPVPPLTPDQVEGVLARWRGETDQVPPAFSAVKVDGVPLHRRARRGEDVVPPTRTVRIHRLELLEMALPDLVVDVECSAGTYVRSLARDVGDALGTGGTLWELRRVRSGAFSVDEAHSLDDLEAAGPEAWDRVLPPERMVYDLARVDVSAEDGRALLHGRAVAAEGSPGTVAAFDPEGRLVAIAERGAGVLKPRKVFLETA